MQPRRDDTRFWERLARTIAALHTSTTTKRFGWHRPGWLGRLSPLGQDNTWHSNGHAFLAERRNLRWLSEQPKVRDSSAACASVGQKRYLTARVTWFVVTLTKSAGQQVTTKPAGHSTALRPDGETPLPALLGRNPFPLRRKPRSIHGEPR
jgi:Fructosamine kinase